MVCTVAVKRVAQGRIGIENQHVSVHEHVRVHETKRRVGVVGRKQKTEQARAMNYHDTRMNTKKKAIKTPKILSMSQRLLEMLA